MSDTRTSRTAYIGPCKYKLHNTIGPDGYPKLEVSTTAGWQLVITRAVKQRVCKRMIPGFIDPVQSGSRKGHTPYAGIPKSEHHMEMAQSRNQMQVQAISKMISDAGTLFREIDAKKLDYVDRFILTREYMRAVRKEFETFCRRGQK